MDLAVRFESRQTESNLSGGSPSVRSGERKVVLSAKEQRRLFDLLRRSDPTDVVYRAIRARLVTGNLHLAVGPARALRTKPEITAELIQENVLALVEAVDAFTVGPSSDFAKFASDRIAKRAKRLVERRSRERRMLVYRTLEHFSDYEGSDPSSGAMRAQAESTLEIMLKQLPEIEQRVIRLRFGLDEVEAQTRESVCSCLRMNLMRVTHLEERALLALRRVAYRWRERYSSGVK